MSIQDRDWYWEDYKKKKLIMMVTSVYNREAEYLTLSS